MLKKIINLISNNDNIVVQSNNIINGKLYNGNITINGNIVQSLDCNTTYEIIINGPVNKIDTQGHVTVNGDVTGKISTQGRVEVQGNVNGDIDTQGRVEVQGNVSGDIDTMGSIKIGSRG